MRVVLYEDIEAVEEFLEDDEGIVLVESFEGEVGEAFEESEDHEKLPDQIKVLTLTPVASSNLQAAGNVDDILVVCFKGGSVYAYQGVDADVLEEWEVTPSLGSFLASHIKDRFPYERIG